MIIEEEKDKKDKPDEKELNVKVFAPRSPKPKRFSWEKQMPVGEAADEAAQAFEYSPGTPTLAKDGEVLDRDKHLRAAGVRNGDKLELVDIGGGV